MKKVRDPRAAAVMALLMLSIGNVLGADGGASKAEAEAMVKKGVAAIKAHGPERAYVAMNDKGGQYVDRDLYLVVYNLHGVVLAHGGNARMIGKDLLELKDIDGKAFVKERVDLAKAKSAFWQAYKFVNPETGKIEPKAMYCERVAETVVCGGIYN